MPISAALPVAAQLAMFVADRPPVLDVEPTCRADAARCATGTPADACLRSEHDARDRITKEWMEFSAADRDRCLQLSSLGGSPSYAEPVTCLAMARDARALRAKTPPSTTGQALPDTPR